MTTNPKSVITRIPPSPTGHPHLGIARMALFNYLYAKQHGGLVLFRSEDTDQTRSSITFETEIIESLHWLGITWHNDKIIRQSERASLYRGYLEKLIDDGAAYESTEPSKSNPNESVTVVRLRNPNKTISFDDQIRGSITFETTELGDFVIARSLDDALYHFTVVVDDADMGITHVLRGEEHVSNTPRQILIQEALGLPRPIYAHLPLILAPDRSKMSKRHGAVGINEYREQGFLPETLVNYLALLGWNPGTDQEVFTLEELVEAFTIEKVQKGGAIFDLEKLKWLNKQHLSRYSADAQANYLDTALQSAYADTLLPPITARFRRLYPTILERYHTQADIIAAGRAGEWDFVSKDPTPQPALLQWKKDSSPHDVLPRLEHVVTLLTDADFSSTETIKAAIFPYAEEAGRGEVLWPLRVALTGAERSPDPFTVAYAIGRESTLRRVKQACAILQS